jgi:hypothetical protein
LSFSFRQLERLPQALLLAVALHLAAAVILPLWPEPAAPPRPRPRRLSDTPQLLQWSRQLQRGAATPLVAGAPLALDAIPLPPPPPPEALGGFAPAPAAPIAERDQPWSHTSAAAVLTTSLAWLPLEQEGFNPADPQQQSVRRRQRWLSAEHGQLLNRLWAAAVSPGAVEPSPSPPAAGPTLEWRPVDRQALLGLGLTGELQGVSLVQERQVTLVWRERGRWWLVRRANPL